MRSADKAPFGLDPVQPAFDRATRLAKLLFGALDSSIVLIDGARVWRSRGLVADRGVYTPARNSAARRVMASERPLWSEDAQIGRAAGRERVCPYGWISVVAGSLKKKK